MVLFKIVRPALSIASYTCSSVVGAPIDRIRGLGSNLDLVHHAFSPNRVYFSSQIY